MGLLATYTEADCSPLAQRLFGLGARKGIQGAKKRISGFILYITVTMTISTEYIRLFYIFVARQTFFSLHK